MAKKSDQLAGGFETENTGGLLSGLLADEEHLDRRAMFRLGTWGVASVGAVVIAVLANQSAIKTRRDDVAALDLTRQSQQIQSVAREGQNETRRLASAIDTLNGDRDRLYSRLTTIEQGLDSVTGAITKQNLGAAALPAIPPATPPKVTPPAAAAAPQPVDQTAAPDPAPAVAPVTTSVAPVTAATATPTPEKPAPEKPRADAKKPAPPAAATVAAAPAASAVPSTPPAAPSSAPLMASKSLMGPPDATAGKLIEPEPPAKAAAAMPAPSPPPPASMASAPAPDAAASKPAPEKVAAAEPALSASPPLAVKHTEFGVDVGGANSVGGLRALWRGLLKSRSNAALAALQPIIVVKERDNGLGMQLRLVAGPLSDAAAAAKICARLAENDHPCETSVFDGQRLAFKADDAPARTESIAAKREKPSTEKPSPEKSAPEAASEQKPASEKPAATKPGSSRYFHRRSYSSSKRAAVVEDPPKKPETSSGISSFFSSRIHSQ
ncbi:MAG: hypothetical protein ABI192_09520 [Bradyrhizobium sp.]